MFPLETFSGAKLSRSFLHSQRKIKLNYLLDVKNYGNEDGWIVKDKRCNTLHTYICTAMQLHIVQNKQNK